MLRSPDGLRAPQPGTLRFRDIWFRYRRSGADVLAGLTWDAPPGTSVLLGPNGAGKTTLLAIGATALWPGHGTVTFRGLVAHGRRDRTEYRRLIGWMPQVIRSVGGLTCHEQVAYAGWLKGMSRSSAWKQARVALDLVALSDHLGRPSAQLSGGQLKRVGLAQALIAAPTLLLLDEPTAGLDPAQRIVFREIMDRLPSNATVLVSTHHVDDLSDLYEMVTVIDNGALSWQGTVADFMALAPDGSARPAEEAYARLVPGTR